MTRYELFRKRIAPVAFLVVVGLIAHDACQKQEREHATIVIDLGTAAKRVQSVDAQLIVEGEPVGLYHRTALPNGGGIGPCRFDAVMPKPDGELRLDIDLGGTHRKLTRHVHADEGATVTVSIGDDLAH